MRELVGHRVDACTRDDWRRVQSVFDTDPAYFERVELAPMRADEALHAFDEAPPAAAAHRVVVIDDVAVLDYLEGFPEPHIWYLGLVFVAPAARGRGLGTRLIDALGATLRARGASALRLAVMRGNPDARRLYERLGFRLVASRTRTSWNGAVGAVDVMQRDYD